MIITLDIITNIYSVPDEQGNQKLIKRGLVYKKQFNTCGILAEEYITQRGEISKKVCTVREGENFYQVKKSFDEMQKLIDNVHITGFKIQGNVTTKRNNPVQSENKNNKK
jgi:hypothetical protein